MAIDVKQEILQKTLKIFLKHGIREMPNQKLVELLGVSTKTIYKYFKNKEGLLEEVLYLHHGKQYEMLESFSPEENAACVFFNIWQKAIEIEYKINKEFYTDLHYYYPELEAQVNAAVGLKFEQYFLSIIQRGVAQGVFRNDFLPEVALQSVLVLLSAAVRTGEYKKFRLSVADLHLNTIVIFIRGLCTEQGIKALEEHIQSFEASRKPELASK